ncbi:MAG: hypothetical protein LBD55_03125, partial [Treponema sp.]|nr:hypothetical protein [Treponema sp.]
MKNVFRSSVFGLRSSAVLLAAALVVLGGCAKKDGAAGSSGGITLTFFGWEASPLETQAIKNGIAKFEAENPGIKVVYT